MADFVEITSRDGTIVARSNMLDAVTTHAAAVGVHRMAVSVAGGQYSFGKSPPRLFVYFKGGDKVMLKFREDSNCLQVARAFANSWGLTESGTEKSRVFRDAKDAF